MLRGIRLGKKPDDEGERPFWISFADLMTALMVLFLVVMVASLLSLTRTVDALQETKKESAKNANAYARLQATESKRAARIAAFWEDLRTATRGLGVRINTKKETIDFGDRGRFASGSDSLSAADQLLLRRFTPKLLGVARSKVGASIVNRIIVAGYADRRGTYLYNLNLSSNRSQRVLCVLLQPGGAAPLAVSEKAGVRDLFSVGGFSFNESQRSLEASRRVEIKIDFLPAGGKRAAPRRSTTAYGDCPLGG